MSEILDAYWAAPPFARNLATAIVLTSLAVYYTTFVPFRYIYFDESRLFRFPPEIWRFVTSFLLSGPNLGLILDPMWAYQYLRQIEVGNPRFARKEDVLWYLITVGGFIIAMNRLYFGDVTFLQGLIIAMCYTTTQDQRGQKAGFFFFTVPAQALPYCMIAMTLLMGGSPLGQISGLLSAHLYDFLSRLWPEFGGGPNLIPAPAFLSWIVQTPREAQRDFGTAVRPAGSTGSGRGTSTGSVLPDSWKTRGTGHRLG